MDLTTKVLIGWAIVVIIVIVFVIIFDEDNDGRPYDGDDGHYM